MRSANKSFALFLIVIIAISCLMVVKTIHTGLAQSGTNVTGIINSPTTWTQTNSPYTLTGNVLVKNGVTLTIDAGTTVNLGSYTLTVNGTLRAIGNIPNSITFNGGQITFSQFGANWNESTGAGCLVENALLNSTLEIDNAAKISNDTIYSSVSTMDAITIQTTSGTPVISYNIIEGDLSNSLVEADIFVASNANANILDNTIMNVINSQNVDTSGVDAGFSYYGSIAISGNTISHCYAGIDISGESQGSGTPLPLIEGNLIVNNTMGIYINMFEEASGPIIENNTIAYNNVGIDIYSSSSSSTVNPTVTSNNIYGNTIYNVKNQNPSNINANYNWWGTTDTQAINQTIYDFKDDFTLGTVSFVPFLSAANPDAPNYPSTSLPSPTPTPTSPPSPSPTPTPTSAYPSITLDPSIGSVGTAVVAKLSGFPAYVAIIITFGTTNVGTITTATGGGSVQFTVPQVAFGTYNVTATGTLGGAATSFFFVGQAVTTSPTPTPMPTSTPTPSPPPVPTPTPTPTPSLPTPNLSFYCISSTTTSGFNVQIQGSLTYNGVSLSGVGIQLSDSVTGGVTWQDLAYAITAGNGSFSVVWLPSASGNDLVKATWFGNGTYSAVSTIVNFAVAPFGNQGQNVFSVTSNSTLTSLTFDPTTNELSFGVSGPSGTTGFTEVCIPQSLVPDISKLNVMLDGGTINYNSVSEGSVWLITFTYHHSSHTVVIALGSSTVPEFPTWIILPLFAAVILSIVFIKKRIPSQ
jgi:lipopolysaccharide export system protein LptA